MRHPHLTIIDAAATLINDARTYPTPDIAKELAEYAVDLLAKVPAGSPHATYARSLAGAVKGEFQL